MIKAIMPNQFNNHKEGGFAEALATKLSRKSTCERSTFAMRLP